MGHIIDIKDIETDPIFPYTNKKLCFTAISDSYIIQTIYFIEIKQDINHCNGDRRSNFQIRLLAI